MIVRGKRNKQNRNWFYFNLSFEGSSFMFNNFKTEKLKLTFEGWNRPVCNLFGFTRVSFCQNCISPSNSEANCDGADAESPFPLFFSFLSHLRTLAQEKRSEIAFVLRLVGGVSVSIHYCREISEYFSPRLQFARAIRVHYRDLEHAYIILNLIARLC